MTLAVSVNKPSHVFQSLQNREGVVAIDPDFGDNGKLKYEIEKIWRYGEPATIYDSHRFIMESDTGKIWRYGEPASIYDSHRFIMESDTGKIWRYGEPATIYDSHRFIMESDTGTHWC